MVNNEHSIEKIERVNFKVPVLLELLVVVQTLV
jgi:hypothetical protein